MLEEYLPNSELKMLLSIPHSGTDISPYSNNLIGNHIEDIDFYVHKLINKDVLLENGIGILKSNISRAICDLNRKRSDSFFHWYKNTLGENIYSSVPIEKDYKYWDEYYSKILSYSNKNMLLLDLHSMPSVTKRYHYLRNPFQSKYRPDICISDLSFSKKYGKAIKETFSEEFNTIKINNPYKGGNIIRSFHKHFKSAIQIEINRKLYMDEENKELNNKIDLTNLIISISNFE